MMAGRDSSLFAVSIQKGAIPVSAQPSPDAPAAAVQNMRLAFTSDGSAVYKPVAVTSPPTSYQPDGSSANVIHQQGSLSAGLTVSGGQVKRKRGRPRKYGPDGTMALALTPVSSSLPSGYPPSSATGPTTPTTTASGKKRGRPLGSGKKQQLAALGSPGIGFMPHVVTVKAGEDVASKIMSFSQQGPRTVCILSANGAISNVRLRQPATSGGSVTYEGRFEILSLCGSFLLSESGGQRSRTGGLSVSLAGPDGRVLGGVVAGLLMAASPVQVIVGSFIAEGRKPEPKVTDLPVPSKLTTVGAAAATSSPPSRGTLSESSDSGPGSPLNHSTGGCNNSQPGNTSMPWK